MSGKLIYMCQLVMMVIMVQMGFYVLVESVYLFIFDVIFICIGAVDDLVLGQLIFMVEMMEVNNVILYVIKDFFIFFDELGWGIVIYDGMVFVQFIIEYIYEYIGVKIFFVIYYYELISLEFSL